jgi:uncharacterized MAPEG superfamily protein
VTTPLLCLFLYAAWTILLVGGVGGWRVAQVLSGKKAANEFPSGTPHGTDLYWRLNRAHLNATENLPIFAAVVIGAHLANATGEWLDNTCIIVLVARVAQSLIHISSNTSVAVVLRLTAFLTQMFAIGYVIIRVVT